MKMNGDRSMDTRERLLQAAGEIFSRCGFRAATVREIARCADVNIAAISYHFGDKQGLYSAVLKATLHSAFRRYPPDIGLRNEAGPEESLRAFVRSLLLRVFDSGRPAWHWCLMAREMADPTSALDELVNEAIRPVHERLRGIVRELVGEGATDVQVRYCMACILGQCLYFHHAKAVLKRLSWPEPGLEEVEPLTKHITEFSLSALRAIREKTSLQEQRTEGNRAAGNGKG